MRLKKHWTVALPVARSRALRALLLVWPDLVPAAFVGMHIWPENELRAQGLGAAASRILVGLQKDGLARWDVKGDRWGYQLTVKGRLHAENQSVD